MHQGALHRETDRGYYMPVPKAPRLIDDAVPVSRHSGLHTDDMLVQTQSAADYLCAQQSLLP
jgi:hypothetical protein